MTTLRKRFDDLPQERQFRCEKLPGLANRLERVIRQLESWQVRVADLGRLQSAVKTLRKAAEAGTYPVEENALRRIAEAIRIAQDFGQIVDAIGDSISNRLARELQLALKGTLEGMEANRTPFQFQAQYWFGAAMIRAGLDPVIPTDRRKNPDFVVCPGTVRYGVEVKRPVGSRGIVDTLKSARDQLDAADMHGVVVLDLSDCLDDLGLRRFVPTADDRPHDKLKPEYRALVEEAVGQVWDSDRREFRPGYSRIFGIWALARGWRWVLDDLQAPQFFEMQGMQRLASTVGNVWFYRAEEFFRKMLVGLRDGGFVLYEAEQETNELNTRPFWVSA